MNMMAMKLLMKFIKVGVKSYPQGKFALIKKKVYNDIVG